MEQKIITISREYASGGRTIGRRVAEELGIPFYDTYIIRETMAKTGLDENLIRSAEQRVTSSFLFNIAMGVDPAHNYITKIHEAEKEIIQQKLSEGPCVIIGRSANFILNERIRALQVFIYSDEKSRVEYAVKNYGVDENEALTLIRRSDRERNLYSKNFYDEDWGERTNYDMMLNSAMFGIEGCVSQIVHACREYDRKMEASKHE